MGRRLALVSYQQPTHGDREWHSEFMFRAEFYTCPAPAVAVRPRGARSGLVMVCRELRIRCPSLKRSY